MSQQCPVNHAISNLRSEAKIQNAITSDRKGVRGSHFFSLEVHEEENGLKNKFLKFNALCKGFDGQSCWHQWKDPRYLNLLLKIHSCNRSSHVVVFLSMGLMFEGSIWACRMYMKYIGDRFMFKKPIITCHSSAK